jgi:FKBP-type peptidyl-prolyl cis-trans isomerase FkpA
MTEITRVPLQPIARGALSKLWLGVLLAVALGGAVAYETRQKGLQVDTVKAGAGAMPTQSDYVLVNYVGHLASGKEFDRGDRVPIPVQGVIPGFAKALQQMQKGGKYHVFIPARLAYGAQEQRNQQTGEVTIPANSDLIFDIDLVDFKSAAEVMRQRMMMQQLQQQLRGAGGAPAGAPGSAPGGPDGAVPVQ